MTESSVHELLKQLHETLGSKATLTDADRELLRQLAADIQSALAREGEPAEARPGTLADRLQAAVTHFEVTHPDLTAAMSRAAKTLGDMGI